MAITRQGPQTASGITINGAGLSLNPGHSTITLGGLNSNISNVNPFANLSSGGTINLNEYWDNPNVKKYEIIETTEDLMALSATWYRIRMSRETSNPVDVFPTTCLDKVLFPHVTNEDRELAQKIRDYYSKKIMFWKLKGKELNNFEKDMNEFIHTDGLKFQEKMIPLVYSLPGFYAYALEYDQMLFEHNTAIKDFTNEVNTKRLNLVKVLNSGKRYGKKKEYWFSDESAHLVKMVFAADNPLLTLLDIYTQDTIIVNGLFTKLTRDDKDYFMVTKQKFI
jgi:hypothetical protein